MDMTAFALGLTVGKKNGSKVEMQEKEITITENGTTEVLPDDGLALSKVTVSTNVKSGGAELNIAYGDAAPADTSKLWVKTSEPSKVIVTPNLEYSEDSNFEDKIETLSQTVPVALAYHACSAVGSKIYCFGGKDNTANSNAIYCFDARTQEVRTLTTVMPTALMNICAATVGEKIYIFGGNTKDVYCFNANTEQIAKLTISAPSAIGFGCCVAVGTKIYIFQQEVNVYCFDTDEPAFTELPSLQTRATNRFCTAVGTKVYIMGGLDGVPQSTIYCLDTEAKSVEQLSITLPIGLHNARCVAVGTNIYICGGSARSSNNYASGVIYIFDTVEGKFTTSSVTLPLGNYGYGIALVDSKIYILGGYGGSNNSTRFDTIIRYSFALLLLMVEHNALHIVPQISDKFIPIINVEKVKIEVGFDSAYKGNEDGIGERVEAALYKDGAWTSI